MNIGRRFLLYWLILVIIGTTFKIVEKNRILRKEQDDFIILRECIQRKDDYSELSIKPVVERTEANQEKYESDIGEILPEYRKLYEENQDLAGWIRIEGTGIDYPVMQTLNDREYYLHRNFQKEESYSGMPFAGTGNLLESDDDIFIYGHNMKNRTMFTDLMRYENQEFWKKHPIIVLDTLYEHREYKIFTVFYANEDEWEKDSGLIYPVIRNMSEKRSEYLERIMQEGLYDTGIETEIGKALLFLITCSYQEKNQRFVVLGMQID